MSNLLSTGISGLNAAQVALSTVGNNISNTDTAGYSRQVVRQVEAVSPGVPGLTIGSGVTVQSVERAYSDYLTSAVWTSNANLQRATTYNDLTTTLNSSLASSGDLQAALDSFYGGFSTVASAPSDSSGRQALLGDAQSVTTVFNTLGQQLDSQQGQINSQITSTVKSVNTIIGNIADLNTQIRQASVNGQPNALLDQRDALVSQLSGYLGVKTVAEQDGTMSVYSTSGQSLVSGGNSFKLSTGSDGYDPTRVDVFDSSGSDITSRLSGGSLGALLDYRVNVLDPAQNQLGQAVVALASSVNAQQARGLDLSGQQGADIFSLPTPQTLPAASNTGTAAVSTSISDVSALTASDYTLRYDGAAWSLASTSGQSVALTINPDNTLSGAGLTFAVSGTAQAGDSYRIKPTAGASSGLAVSLTDPSGIAAAAAVAATPGTGNAGSGAVNTLTVTDASNAALSSSATVSFPTAGTYQITDAGGVVLSSGAYTSGQALSANGWSLTLSGAPAAGDSFAIAANTNGLNDNSNALALAGLADTGVLDGGSTSIIDAYTNLTTQIGNAGSLATSNLTTQTALNDQAVSAQQAVSGVNLDEEAANLVRYQQSYQASAQVISTAQTIFSSLLAAVQG